MTEREYDYLLHIVEKSVSETDGNTARAGTYQPIHAANDNGWEWPLVAFPEGWTASP